MKFFAIASAILLTFTNSQELKCGMGKVPNSESLCIEPEYIEGCQVYAVKDECKTCQKGYVLNNKRCDTVFGSELPPKIIGCLERQEQGSACKNCANGYLLQNGACIKGVKNCLKHNTDYSCQQCKANFSLVIGQCKHNILLGCKKARQDHVCEECWEPFKLSGDHCDINACQTLNDFGCVTCECGFYLTSDRKCQQIDKGCMRYERGRCINCLPHFKLKGGACEIEGCEQYLDHNCLKCSQNYDLVDGGCHFKNCYDWTEQKCVICNEGYKVRQGKCEKQDNLVCQD